ncbi:YfhO family protein, partial [Klebsiella pneumoniae]|nr:YfhO family protein [Klebsiella pneumoniae]
LKLALSTSYALMSFTVSQLEIKTWLDVFILIPLIITGLHLLITEKKLLLYFTSLSILFIQNYYFGYMTVLFLIFWYLCQISWDFKTRKSSVLDFIVISFLAGMASLIITLPTLFDLQTHGEKLTEVTKFQTESSWYLDLFAKQFIGSFDTTKYGA